MEDKSIRKSYIAHIQPSIARAIDFLGGEIAINAKGATIRTSENREVIDLASGGFGYAHPHVLEQVRKQVTSLPLSSRVFLSRPMALLLRKIAEMVPGDLNVSYPCNSPSEAVEGALKMARGFNKKRNKIVSTVGAYHGATMGALSVCGLEKNGLTFRGHSLHVEFVPYGDPGAIRRAIDEDTTAVILEPIKTVEGVVIPPPEYFKEIKNCCQGSGSLLILDESNTGLGHCGKLFGASYQEVVPDIIVLGLSLGGGIVPGGAYVTHQSINNKVYGREHPALHGSTTGGNPLMCTAGFSALEVIESEGLAQQAMEKGKVISSFMKNYLETYGEIISTWDVCGLLAVIELSMMNLHDKPLLQEIRRKALCLGVAVKVSILNEKISIVLNPPLIISHQELATGLTALGHLIKWLRQKSEPSTPVVDTAQQIQIC